MIEQDERIEIVESKAKPGLVRRYLTGTTSLVGSVTSMARTVKVGADAIGSGMESLSATVKSVTSNARVESFEQACSRLGIAEQDLPRIHNQILVQLYGTFVVGLIAVLAAVFYITAANRGVLVPLICVGTALGGFAMCAQSSLQAMQIRMRKLGLLNEWLGSPSYWFPRRIHYEQALRDGDSRLDRKMAAIVASRCRRQFLVALAFALIAALGFCACVPGTIPGSGLLASVVTALSVGRAVSLSVLVMQASDGRECDLLYWLTRPSRWIP